VAAQPLQIQSKALPITVSIGISANIKLANIESMMHLADERLYMAKSAGRNRTVAG
jgi:diguanylate cyclase (GGDEF)-like protein